MFSDALLSLVTACTIGLLVVGFFLGAVSARNEFLSRRRRRRIRVIHPTRWT